jgi:hypothetical protein
MKLPGRNALAQAEVRKSASPVRSSRRRANNQDLSKISIPYAGRLVSQRLACTNDLTMIVYKCGESRYMAKPTDLVQGTLDLLILKTISLEPKHGWAIAKRIQQVSQEALQIQQGSLYPALHRRCFAVRMSTSSSKPNFVSTWISSLKRTFHPVCRPRRPAGPRSA